MLKLNQAREEIAQALAEASVPAIALTFGKDSLLLAALVLQQAPETNCIWLHQMLTKTQKQFPEQVIVDWNLSVWSCGVQSWSIVDEKYVACEYVINGTPLVIVHDLVHDEREACLLQKRPRFSPPIQLPVDLFFVGWRKEDRHELMGEGYAPTFGNAAIATPLADWTEAEVWEATKVLSLPVNEQKYIHQNPLYDPDNLIANLTCVRQGVCTCQP